MTLQPAVSVVEFDGCNASHLSAISALFERCGNSCYCRYWHFTGDKNDWQLRCAVSPELNRDDFAQQACERSEETRGALMLNDDGVAIAWIKLLIGTKAHKLREQRYYRALPMLRETNDEGVYFIGCMLVDPASRRTGLVHHLVSGGCKIAKQMGAKRVVAIPREFDHPVPDEELFTGTPAVYESLGFTHVTGEKPYRVFALELC